MSYVAFELVVIKVEGPFTFSFAFLLLTTQFGKVKIALHGKNTYDRNSSNDFFLTLHPPPWICLWGTTLDK